MSARLLCFAGVILEDVVHLLECTALGLGDEEEGPDKCEETEDGEEDVRAVTGVFDQRRGDEALSSLAICEAGGANDRELTMIKLFSQFEQVERATPLARREEGKTSIVCQFYL